MPQHVKFRILMAAGMKMQPTGTLHYVVSLKLDPHDGGRDTSEMPVCFKETTQRYVPEEYHPESLISLMYFLFIYLLSRDL
jgi:hypothetical protein